MRWRKLSVNVRKKNEIYPFSFPFGIDSEKKWLAFQGLVSRGTPLGIFSSAAAKRLHSGKLSFILGHFTLDIYERY